MDNIISKKTMIILGKGQYSKVVKELIRITGLDVEISFLDDNNLDAIDRLSKINELSYDAAFVAIGNAEVREYWSNRIDSDKLSILIHSAAIVMPSAKIGKGSIIEAGAVISSNAEVGQGCIIMSNVVVGHDAKVGDYCQLKYGCVVPERCVVPDKTKIDCNEVWRNQIDIQENNRSFLEEEKAKNGVEPSFF